MTKLKLLIAHLSVHAPALLPILDKLLHPFGVCSGH